MAHYNVLIVGAGAAGLMAMRELIRAGYKVCLLEAEARAGGRIASQFNGFVTRIERGAEFIHGKAPLTFELLKDAHISYAASDSKMYTVANGVWMEGTAGDNHFDEVIQKINTLESDCSLSAFLDANFPANEYDGLRKSVTGFAEGFSLADPGLASARAFQKELAELEADQHYLPGGYAQLINYLLEGCRGHGSVIHFSSPVDRVVHQPGVVTAYTKNDKKISADKVIITVSAGVLQSGDIRFIPALEKQYHWIRQLGFGSVLKFHLQFNEPFWLKIIPEPGFILSDEIIPTWWTQPRTDIPILTGWLGGPKVKVLNLSDKLILLDKALASLSSIFHLPLQGLTSLVNEYEITSWDRHPFTRGGYSYTTIHSTDARECLLQPVNDTIYFAGEALYTGELQGTVEAALVSGKKVAAVITESRPI